MSSLWSLHNLPLTLQKTYAVLVQERRLVKIDDENCIAFSGSLEGREDDVAKLIQLNLVEKKRIGRRTILILGSWKLEERPLSREAVYSSTVFTGEMLPLLERYAARQREILEETFTAFAGIRKQGRISPRILLQQLQTYDTFPADAVEQGLQIYLDGGYADRGVGERYALGIIRGCAKNLELRTPVRQSAVAVRELDDREGSFQQRQQQRRADRVELDRLVDKELKLLYGPAALVSQADPRVVAGLIKKAREMIDGASSVSR